MGGYFAHGRSWKYIYTCIPWNLKVSCLFNEWNIKIILFEIKLLSRLFVFLLSLLSSRQMSDGPLSSWLLVEGVLMSRARCLKLLRTFTFKFMFALYDVGFYPLPSPIPPTFLSWLPFPDTSCLSSSMFCRFSRSYASNIWPPPSFI